MQTTDLDLYDVSMTFTFLATSREDALDKAKSMLAESPTYRMYGRNGILERKDRENG